MLDSVMHQKCYWLSTLTILLCSINLVLTANTTTEDSHHTHGGVRVASLRYEYVKSELVLTVFIVLIGVFKLLYHHYRYPRELIPESCCLIILGVVLGQVFFWASSDTQNAVRFLEFDSKVFFFFLLPPIILESAYSLNDKGFYSNLGTILLFAVVGTVLNIALVGSVLIFLDYLNFFGELGLSSLDSLLFASLIAAVDPVAVLAIFAEVGVNKTLYFMVFGESLLNDAVTVVCYNLIGEFKELPRIEVVDCLIGVLSFACVSFGGLLIGLFYGFLGSYMTKFTISARVEPVICMGMAYLAYVCSELFHFSGIIAMIGCGVVQARYTMPNLSAKSNTCIEYAVKVISSVSESLIFIILGVMLVNERNWFWSDWHPTFAFTSLALCVVARVAVVFFLSYIVNAVMTGSRQISIREQVIMAYGGLRGAVSFSLAFMIPDSSSSKSTILAATYVVILFTVFGQGCTIEFLVKCLNINLAKKDDKYRLFRALNKGMVNHLMEGMEEMLNINRVTLFSKIADWNQKYLQPFLERDYQLKQAHDKLVCIENEERLKESLLENKASLRQLNKLSTNGSHAQLQIVQDHHENVVRQHRGAEDGQVRIAVGAESDDSDLEAEVDALTNNLDRFNALVSGSLQYQADRNLVSEVARERRRSLRNRHYQKHVNRLAGLPWHETKKKRPLWGLGQKRNVKKMSIRHGVLAASTSAVGVGNQNEQ